MPQEHPKTQFSFEWVFNAVLFKMFLHYLSNIEGLLLNVLFWYVLSDFPFGKDEIDKKTRGRIHF